MVDSFIEVSGLRLRIFRSTGSAGGGQPPLLLINGLGSGLETWQPLARELAHRDLLMVDHPGMGQSQTPKYFIGMKGLADLYVSVLDELGVDRVDVLGFSFGGTLAQQLAHDHPSRVNKLVLAATSCGLGGVPADFMTLLLASNPLRYQFPAARRLSAPFIYRGRAGRHPELFTTELKGMGSHPASLCGVFLQVAAFSSWSSLPWLRKLTMPTLILAGSEDPMAPVANSQLLASKIPGAVLEVFDRGGHLFMFESAAQVAPVIDDFLDHEQAIAV